MDDKKPSLKLAPARQNHAEPESRGRGLFTPFTLFTVFHTVQVWNFVRLNNATAPFLGSGFSVGSAVNLKKKIS